MIITAKSWRLYITEITVSQSGYPVLGELTLQSEKYGLQLAVGLSTFGSTVNGIATASSTLNSDRHPRTAFDNYQGLPSWSAGGVCPQWLAFEFFVPTALGAYELSNSIDAVSNNDFVPKSWQLQFWDGLSWQTASTVKNHTFTDVESHRFLLGDSIPVDVYQLAVETLRYNGIAQDVDMAQVAIEVLRSNGIETLPTPAGTTTGGTTNGDMTTGGTSVVVSVSATTSGGVTTTTTTTTTSTGTTVFGGIPSAGGLIGGTLVSTETSVTTTTSVVSAAPVLPPVSSSRGNINMLRDLDNDAGYYAAVTSTDVNWRGSGIFISSDAGATYNRVALLTSKATIGRAALALGNFSGGNIPDEQNRLVVTMQYGTLDSVSYASFLRGEQVAIIGDEIVGFRTAVLNADGSYTVSGLLRGLRGSGYATASHSPNERFVRVSPSSLSRIPDVTAGIGQSRLYKAVTVGASLSATPSYKFTNTAAGLRPYAPTHLGGGFEADGSARLQWTRRTRVSGEWRDGVDVPLSEDSERYEVQVWDSAFTAIKRTEQVVSPFFIYSAAMQVADFGAVQATVHFRVHQLSAVVGKGYGGQGSVPAGVSLEFAL